MLPEVNGSIDRFKMISTGQVCSLDVFKNGFRMNRVLQLEQSLFSKNYSYIIMCYWNFTTRARVFSKKPISLIDRVGLSEGLQNQSQPPLFDGANISIKPHDVRDVRTEHLEPDVSSSKSTHNAVAVHESNSRIMHIFIRCLKDHIRKYLIRDVSIFDGKSVN